MVNCFLASLSPFSLFFLTLSHTYTQICYEFVCAGVFVDGGYDIQILDVIGKAFGCTNGIIYIIDGFLNYSPLTILERLKREPSVR